MSMIGGQSPGSGSRRLRLDDASASQSRPGRATLRRLAPLARRYRWTLALLLLMSAFDAAATSASPLLLKVVINDGIIPRRIGTVVGVAVAIALVAVLDGLAISAQTWLSARAGEGMVYDLRTRVFAHVQQQSPAFFARAQTGSLLSRLNTDILSAQQAVTTLLTQAVSAVLSLVLVLGSMFYLSWQVTLTSLAAVVLYFLPARPIGRRLQRLTRTGMQANAQLGSLMSERFNVAGAVLVKLYGRPERENREFSENAARVRDVAVSTTVYSRIVFTIGSVLAALTTAVVYGLGGVLVVHDRLNLGTLVALVALFARLYTPIGQISNMQINVLTALVSFDRVFEVLDLEPLVQERADARVLRLATAGEGDAADIEFEHVWFRYPGPEAVSIASLEPPGRDDGHAAAAAGEPAEPVWALRDVSFRLPAGSMTALVGPSGAGKTTITQLVPRLYDPDLGGVRIGGQDLRELTLESLNAAIGVVPQDAHLFHDTIRANLSYVCPEADEERMIEACRAAQIWPTIAALPDRLDTIVGERGYRLSGGEKQRIALARLLLKAPPIVILDEATAHLDSESEAAVQRALRTALVGRTSMVIAHRLSTVRDADQILVVDMGGVREAGTHEDLLTAGGLYAELYHTQFESRAEPENAGAGRDMEA